VTRLRPAARSRFGSLSLFAHLPRLFGEIPSLHVRCSVRVSRPPRSLYPIRFRLFPFAGINRMFRRHIHAVRSLHSTLTHPLSLIFRFENTNTPSMINLHAFFGFYESHELEEVNQPFSYNRHGTLPPRIIQKLPFLEANRRQFSIRLLSAVLARGPFLFIGKAISSPPHILPSSRLCLAPRRTPTQLTDLFLSTHHIFTALNWVLVVSI